jgi:hypothetical protein
MEHNSQTPQVGEGLTEIDKGILEHMLSSFVE